MKADLSEVTVFQLQDDMAAGARTSAGICEGYLAAIAALLRPEARGGASGTGS